MVYRRGLRRPDDKKVLTVIDYIGNHRTFLLKPMTLLDLPSSDAALERALNALQAGELTLPEGCEVTYDLEAVDILRALLRKPSREEVVRIFYQGLAPLKPDWQLVIAAVSAVTMIWGNLAALTQLGLFPVQE